jgi:hypothetical protein
MVSRQPVRVQRKRGADAVCGKRRGGGAFAGRDLDGRTRAAEPARRTDDVMQAQQQAVAFGRDQPGEIVDPRYPPNKIAEVFADDGHTMGPRRPARLEAATRVGHADLRQRSQIGNQRIAHRAALVQQHAEIRQRYRIGNRRLHATAAQPFVDKDRDQGAHP